MRASPVCIQQKSGVIFYPRVQPLYPRLYACNDTLCRSECLRVMFKPLGPKEIGPDCRPILPYVRSVFVGYPG